MPQKCPLKVNRPKPRLYNRRLIRSGNVLELYEYGKPVMRGAVVHGSAFYGRANAPYTSAETKRENRAKIARRARETVRRTINANPQLDKFFTLTYAENLQDVPQARKEFDVFIKRLKRLHPHLQYVCVIVFQERGAIHFHLLCNLPYVVQSTLQSLWGHGIVHIQRPDNVDNIGAYMTKYMSKGNIDDRLVGHKCYTMSRGLKQPQEYTTEEEIEEALAAVENVKRVYTAEFESEYYGTIRYTQIICERQPQSPRRTTKPRNRWGAGGVPQYQQRK